MAITAARVTVSTAAIALNAAESGAVSGARLVVKNTHATDACDLGDSSVTAGTGFSLAAGATLTIDLPHGEQLYAIRSAAADVVVAVLRLGV
ncbi:MAG: hypothetical protein L0Y54_10100 [Sporichthyaceae bacterium]|nr:hypothetical protein [Sporichthyaceae bacterium]